MTLSATIFILIEFIIGSTAAVVAYVAWNYRDRPAGTPLFAMAVTAMMYMGLSVLASILTDPLLWEIATSLQYTLTAAIAVESFYVAVELTRRREYLRPATHTLFAGVLLASLGTALTNPIHNLLNTPPKMTAEGAFVVTHKPLFWLHTITALTIILFSIWLLTIELADSDGIYREQITAVIAGFLIGILFFLWESIQPIHPSFNLATVGIVGWCFTTLWGVSRVDLLETAPIARKTLIDSMDDAVFALDTENRIVDINPFAREQLEIEAEAVGTPVNQVLSECPLLLEAINADQDTQEITLRKNREKRHLHVKKSPVYDTTLSLPLGKQEKQIGQTVVIRDITDRKQREKELEQQNKRLDEFVSVVSHDLRTPLSVAEGRTQLAQQETDNEHLDAVNQAHNRMETMIDDLLTLARSGQSIDELKPVNLPQIIEDSWQSVQTSEATLINEVNQTIQADPGRLRQLLENLFRNAVEHGGKNITVTVGEIDQGFYIADNGPGIPPEKQEEVFQSGYSTSEGGNGLGLQIVKQIVDGHNWKITVTESNDGGARLEITEVQTTSSKNT